MRLSIVVSIHSGLQVGPDYRKFGSAQDAMRADALLEGAYHGAMAEAKRHKVEYIGFSLLSSGIFRGSATVRRVLRLAVDALESADGYPELREVHLVAFDSVQKATLRAAFQGD